MTEAERVQLENEITLFITSCANSIQSLRYNYCVVQSSDNDDEGSAHVSGLSKSNIAHYDSVATYLVEKLRMLTKRSQHLKRQRVKYNANPLRLLTSGMDSGADNEVGSRRELEHKSAGSVHGAADYSSTAAVSVSAPAAHASGSAGKASGGSKSTVLDSDFVSRYEAEIASPKRIREYSDIASKHKESLLKETALLRTQFDSQLTVTEGMEHSIEAVSSMLSEFLQIIESQSDKILDIRDVSKEATESVTKASEELETTITRTQSFQVNMVILIVGLALLLLVLDYITP